MLDGKGKGLDLQKVIVTKETIDIDGQGMSSQFGVQASTKATKSMSMIVLNVELFH